jgi:hypothetical protein
MGEIAEQLVARRSWVSRLRQAIARRAGDEAKSAEPGISFAELVWAHHQRQQEVYGGVRGGEWEREYRDRLRLFTQQHGEILESYWCRHEASAVVLTREELPRRASNFWRRDEILRLHSATDWRTSAAPSVAAMLHRWEALGIRVSEVLRDSSERIALQRIFAASTRLLAFVDREPRDEAKPLPELKRMLGRQEHELACVRDYYARAGENSARIVYFRGMLWGTLWLAVFVALLMLALWPLDTLHPHDAMAQGLFVSLGMGALGAIVSVMTRMAAKDGFSLDFEVGRKSVRQLGGLRPWIGGVLALVVYLALQSDLVQLGQPTDKLTFYATVAFVAGFSERRTKILLDGIALGGEQAPAPAEPPKRARRRV